MVTDDFKPNGHDPSQDKFRAASVLIERMQWARSAGLSFGGDRDLYSILGYSRTLTSKEYRDRYARGGIAGRVVDALPKATWRGGFELVEDENPKTNTTFEQAWNDLDTRLKITSKLQKVDILSGLSNFAVLLIGAPGELDTELPKGKPEKLLYVQPYSGGGGPTTNRSLQQAVSYDGDCTIKEFETDPKNERFGLPKFYQIRRLDIYDPTFQKPVHWTRIIHVAEDTLDDEVYGAPSLERVWNLLDDLDKVTGGGAEAFWLRANQGLQLDIDKDVQNFTDEERVALKQQADDYKHQISRMMRTRGVTATPLGSDVANFQSPADAILTQIAGAKAIPKRILTGSEMGELASSQDRENWRDQVVGRRDSYADPYIVRPLVDRLIDYGYLPVPQIGGKDSLYLVRFAAIVTMTEDEKATGAKRWAETNATQGAPVYTVSSMRDYWYGFEPLTPEEIEQETPKPAQEVDAEGNPIKMGPDGQPVKVDPNALVPDKKPAGKFPRAASEHKFSTTQIQVPASIGLVKFGLTIPDDELAEDGREDDEHITVKYGIHDEDPADVQQAIKITGPVVVTLGKTSYFEGEGYDVVIVKVVSPDLRKLNKRISNAVEVTDTHPRYTPHATIAYVKKGLGEKYAGDDRFEGVSFEATEIVFSSADDELTIIELRAASAHEEELITVLAEAIKANNTDVIHAIIGVDPEASDFPNRTLGGPGSGRYPAGSSGNEGFENPSTPQSIARSFDHAGKMTEIREKKRGAVLDQQPDGTVLKLGRTPYTKITVVGDVFWTDGKYKNISSREMAVNLGTRLEKQFGEIKDLEFNPDQPRDENGKWSGGGGGNSDAKSRPFSAYVPMNANGIDTQQRFSDGKGNYTPERKTLHDEIVKSHFEGKTAVDKPVATFLGGGPASGKSSVSSELPNHDPNTVHIDADQIRSQLPEYKERIAAGQFSGAASFSHEEASEISKRVLKEAAAGNYNVLLDGTGDSSFESLEKKVAPFRTRGIPVSAQYVTIETEDAFARMKTRAANPESSSFGREVPEKFLREIHRSVSQVLPQAMKAGLFDNVTLWDNTTRTPLKVASATKGKITVHDDKAWTRFKAKGVA